MDLLSLISFNMGIVIFLSCSVVLIVFFPSSHLSVSFFSFFSCLSCKFHVLLFHFTFVFAHFHLIFLYKFRSIALFLSFILSVLFSHSLSLLLGCVQFVSSSCARFLTAFLCRTLFFVHNFTGRFEHTESEIFSILKIS